MTSVKPPSVAKTLNNKKYNLIVSVVIGILVIAVLRNISYGIFAFAIGMFLDADHLVDYLLYLIKFRRPFSLKEFISGSYFADWKKFVTPGHSWELALASLIMYTGYGYKISLVAAVALTGHYLVDYFTNDVNKLAYFFLFRLKSGFAKSAIRK